MIVMCRSFDSKKDEKYQKPDYSVDQKLVETIYITMYVIPQVPR